MSIRIQVIVNPASGDGEPKIEILDEAFCDQDVTWELSVTQEVGDIRRVANQAIEEGIDIVAAYGGDGTLNETARALVSTDIPLGILPGGTGNVFALEMGIPHDVKDAARVLCDPSSRITAIDVGQISDYVFLLRAGLGFEADIIADTGRSQKNRFGLLAYVWNGLQNLRDPEIAQYRFRIDGEEVESRGFVAAVVNAGSLGIGGLHLGQPLSLHDGLLDLMVVKETNWKLFLGVLEKVIGDGEVPLDAQEADALPSIADLQEILLHWQGAEIEIDVEPKQNAHYDGEPINDPTWPLVCRAMPNALRVVVPA